jgi:hypothetical protein
LCDIYLFIIGYALIVISPKLIISNIIGGLGNQMFQYACGRALSIRMGQEFKLTTDQFEGYLLHNGFDLQRVFNIDVEHASSSELQSLLGWQKSPGIRWFFGRPAMRWARIGHWCGEPTFEYWPEIMNIHPPVYLHGYWQSEKYFKDVSEQIRHDFSFILPWDKEDIKVRERMNAQPSASIHIRRGDFLASKNKKLYACCDIHYYRQAIYYLRQKIPEIKLFAFSDDPSWVETYLMPEFGEIEIVSHNIGMRSANDMRLMSQTAHHIIANSTFSWWGAWLNPSPNKIVIAPKNWFVNDINDNDLIPSSWLRL